MTTIKQFLTARPKLLTLYVKVGTRLTDILASLSKNVSEHLYFMLFDTKDFLAKKTEVEKNEEDRTLIELKNLKLDEPWKKSNKVNNQGSLSEKAFNSIKDRYPNMTLPQFLYLTNIANIPHADFVDFDKDVSFDKEAFDKAKKDRENMLLAVNNYPIDKINGWANHDYVDLSEYESEIWDEFRDVTEEYYIKLGEKIQEIKAAKEQKSEPIVFQSSVDISTQSISDFDQHLTDAQKDIEANKEVSPVISLILDKSPTKDELEEFKKTFEETKKNNNCCMLNHSSKIELVELKEDDKQITFDDYIKTKDTVNANVSGFETVIVGENK
jgi:hypothetical protein